MQLSFAEESNVLLNSPTGNCCSEVNGALKIFKNSGEISFLFSFFFVFFLFLHNGTPAEPELGREKDFPQKIIYSILSTSAILSRHFIGMVKRCK